MQHSFWHVATIHGYMFHFIMSVCVVHLNFLLQKLAIFSGMAVHLSGHNFASTVFVVKVPNS